MMPHPADVTPAAALALNSPSLILPLPPPAAAAPPPPPPPACLRWTCAPGTVRPSSSLGLGGRRLYAAAGLPYPNHLQPLLRCRAAHACDERRRHTRRTLAGSLPPVRVGHAVAIEGYGRGVVAWVGLLPQRQRRRQCPEQQQHPPPPPKLRHCVGVVLPTPGTGYTDGVVDGLPLFRCPPDRGVVVPRSAVVKILGPPHEEQAAAAAAQPPPLLAPLPSGARAAAAAAAAKGGGRGAPPAWFALSEERAREAARRRDVRLGEVRAVSQAHLRGVSETLERGVRLAGERARALEERVATKLGGGGWGGEPVVGAERAAVVAAAVTGQEETEAGGGGGRHAVHARCLPALGAAEDQK